MALACDVDSAESIKAFSAEVKEAFDSKVDLLFNNAGISNPDHPKDPIISVNIEDLQAVLQTNLIGTILMTQAMLPFMRESEEGLKMIVNMSSQLGSIQNTFGCQGKMGDVSSYRISRAANNMALRTLAAELSEEKFICIAMSPGHVFTDMGSTHGRNPPLQPPQSISGIIQVLSGCTTEQNGKFLQWDGPELQW